MPDLKIKLKVLIENLSNLKKQLTTKIVSPKCLDTLSRD